MTNAAPPCGSGDHETQVIISLATPNRSHDSHHVIPKARKFCALHKSANSLLRFSRALTDRMFSIYVAVIGGYTDERISYCFGLVEFWL